MDEEERLLGVVPKLLELLRDDSPPKQALYWLLVVLSQHSSCESSGIRWRANGDYPYYVTRGFDQRHLVREGSLHDRDAAGEILRHRDGTPRAASREGVGGVYLLHGGRPPGPRRTCNP